MDALTNDLNERTPIFPFGSYDIFSYIIPGATALLCICFFEYWCHCNIKAIIRTPLYSALALHNANSLKDNIALSALYLLAIICVVYVSGHVVSSVSSFTLDRIYTAKGHGYPFETLLLLPKEGGGRKDDSKGFYQGFFFWFNFYLTLRFLSFFYKTTLLREMMDATEWLLAIALALKIVIGVYRSNRNNLSGIKTDLERSSLRSPTRFFTTKIFPIAKKLANFFLTRIFPLGYNIVSRFIQNHLRTARPFNQKFTDLYRACFLERFKVPAEDAGSNNFWLCRLFVSDKSPIFDRYLNYWLHMYSYARNLSTALYMAFLYCFWWIFLNRDLDFSRDHRIRQTLIILPLFYLALSVILLVRFRYIYVGYYNRFLYRAFVYLNEKNDRSAGAPVSITP